MNKMLSYWLKEAETAIRIMFRDKTTCHLFDLSRNRETGEEFVCVIAVVPRDLANEFEARMGGTKPSIPISANELSDHSNSRPEVNQKCS